ncbi:MAG TPA: NADH-quinone oxidoreductase subunit F, partial [Gemmatales bacterium]|nr:NADH-quinone oxidoreductase subunit F [Gemmatales bacterium]
MPTFEPVLLRNVGVKDSHTLAVYRERGGYRGLDKALALSPAQVVDAVKASGLRGRGGAGFPTSAQGSFLPKDHPRPINMGINTHDSEPR